MGHHPIWARSSPSRHDKIFFMVIVFLWSFCADCFNKFCHATHTWILYAFGHSQNIPKMYPELKNIAGIHIRRIIICTKNHETYKLKLQYSIFTCCLVDLLYWLAIKQMIQNFQKFMKFSSIPFKSVLFAEQVELGMCGKSFQTHWGC